MRQQPGTTSLRALVYMDEIAGYLPPVANPASQGADADAAQAGARVRRRHGAGHAEPGGPGLQGACPTPARGSSAGCRPSATRRACSTASRARCPPPAARSIATRIGRIIGGLGKRAVPAAQRARGSPGGVRKRWAMSYLRGPLTRSQIKTLMDGRRGRCGCAGAPVRQVRPVLQVRLVRRAAHPTHPRQAHLLHPPHPPHPSHRYSHQALRSTSLPPKPGATYTPVVAGAADIRFTDTKSGIDDDEVGGVHHADHGRGDSGELGSGRGGGLRCRTARLRSAGRREVRRSSGRGGEAEELRRLAEGVCQLALDVAGL